MVEGGKIGRRYKSDYQGQFQEGTEIQERYREPDTIDSEDGGSPNSFRKGKLEDWIREWGKRGQDHFVLHLVCT